MTTAQYLAAELIAVVVAATAGEPRVLTILDGTALPSGPFELGHRSLQSGLRTWVEEQTHHPLGYVEQLYTFADRDRLWAAGGRRAISISYLGLTRETEPPGQNAAGWRNWYSYFPWEDHRWGAPAVTADLLAPALRSWAESVPENDAQAARGRRVAIAFGLDGQPWNEELILQRYELLYEAALVPEAWRDAERTRAADKASPPPRAARQVAPGLPMTSDHRRILATGIARLRAKIKYRPVVFELMPDSFTLFQLQRAVEGIAGRAVHKQNFRRLVEQQELVEETGETTGLTGGRPAKLFRFRREILAERSITGTKLPVIRA
ncbi:MAG: hypothetical protein JO122_21590 [Acetobacteraceae bacterium]|nr:hypothetical protein [Acetobacteraceae bacterium]